MSARTPSRRLLQSGALQCLHQPSAPSHILPVRSRRTLFNFFGKKEQPAANNGGVSNPILDEYMKRKPSKNAAPQLEHGDLASTSIFDADRQIQEREAEKKAASDASASSETTIIAGQARNPANMAAVLDPKPAVRERWQRKMVIRDIKKGGRLSKSLFIKRTERESTSQSQNMKTSIKKLGMLARQIAGKNIDDAIVQMRFSKKKAAKEVLEYLEFARDEAIVKRGMGLGNVASQADGTKNATAPVEIQLKDGKRHTVVDPNKIFVDQAWVGRGPYGKLPDYRAKGRINIMYTPWTHLGVVLKEEATRVRQFEEREEKRRRQRESKVWTPLPDRPIQGQRQWFSW
ncbi:hypothetical protein MBLNU459_g0668t1 [Dothideomycetes sp. NU459]